MQKVSTKSIIIADVVLGVILIGAIGYFFGINPFSAKDKKGAIYKPSDSMVMSEARGVAAQCQSQDSEACYKEKFVQLIKGSEFSYAQTVLYALQDIDPQIKSCHVLAHFMGRELVKLDPKKWKEAMATVDVNTCGSGFLHGVLEAHLSDDTNFQLTPEVANEVCDTNEDSYKARMCSHFMGHLALLGAEGNMKRALPVCARVVDRLRWDCFDGLFMEDHQKLALAEHGITPLPAMTESYATKLGDDCLFYEGSIASACWTEMAEIYAKVFNYEPNSVYRNCYNNAPTPSLRESCYAKGVVVLGTYPLELSAETLASICKPYLGEEGMLKGCISNFISSLMYYSPKFTSRGVQLCSLISEASSREWCFGELGRQLKNFVASPAERETLCEKTPKPYKQMCSNT